MSTMLAGKHKRGPLQLGSAGPGTQTEDSGINHMFPIKDKRSLMSSLSRLMILLSPATTDMGKTRLNIKWLSLKTSVFSICYFGLLIGTNLIGYLTGFISQLSMGKTKSSIVVSWLQLTPCHFSLPLESPPSPDLPLQRI